MIQSAAIPGIDAPLSPINARTMTAATLTVVDPTQPLDPTYTELGVAGYNWRDQELLQRDLTVASYIAQLCLQIATVFNIDINTLIIPTVAPSVLQYNPVDLPNGSSPSTPVNVQHVKNSSVPADAITSDQTLYARDAVLYEALARLSFSFPPADRLMEPLDSSITIDETWSRAKGSTTFGDVSICAPLDRHTFFTPDRYLAQRDNVLAFHTATLDQFLLNVLNGAQRLSLRVQSTSTTPIYPSPIA